MTPPVADLIAALTPAERERLDALLAGAGCPAAFDRAVVGWRDGGSAPPACPACGTYHAVDLVREVVVADRAHAARLTAEPVGGV